jgi:hypothetical protein
LEIWVVIQLSWLRIIFSNNIHGYTDKEALFRYLEGDVVDKVLLEYGREVDGVEGGVVAVAGIFLVVILVKIF